jgi:hypothetical protein
MYRVSRLGLVLLFLLLRTLVTSIIIIIIILLTDPDHRPSLICPPWSHTVTPHHPRGYGSPGSSLAALSPSLSLNHTRCGHAI